MQLLSPSLRPRALVALWGLACGLLRHEPARVRAQATASSDPTGPLLSFPWKTLLPQTS